MGVAIGTRRVQHIGTVEISVHCISWYKSSATRQAADKYLEELLLNGFHEPESFIADGTVACRCAVVGDVSNIFDAQMEKFQYPRYVNTRMEYIEQS